MFSKKKSSIFVVSSCYKSIDFEFQNTFSPDTINVKWSRHKRFTDSLKFGEAPIWNKTGEGDNGYIAGRCSYKSSCTPDMRVTLHKGKKGAAFETKIYRYIIESVSEFGRAKTLANADIDFSMYADTNGSTQYLAIEMKPKQKFVLSATLNVRITFEFVKTGNSKDPDMISTFSKESNSIGYASNVTSDCDTSSTIGLVIKENQFSLAHHVQHYHDDVISPGASSVDIFKFLPNCKLIVLVFDGKWIEKSPLITKALNTFYNQIKMHFFTTVETFYVSMDKDEPALMETIQNCNLRCPAVKPHSELSSAITQHFEITKAPHMLVLSDSRIITDFNGPAAIIECLESSDVLKIVEKWLSLSKRTFSTFSLDSITTIVTTNEPPRPAKTKDITAEILREKEAVIENLVTDKAILTTSNAQLEDEVTKLNDKLVRQTSLMSAQAKKERKLTSETKLLEAERDIRGTLMKRGVRGMTGHLWRARFFQFEDNKIIYTDPKTNEIKGFISIAEIISIQKLPKDTQDKNHASFSITVPGRVFEIQARDAMHMQTWIAAVDFLLERDRKKSVLLETLNESGEA